MRSSVPNKQAFSLHRVVSATHPGAQGYRFDYCCGRKGQWHEEGFIDPTSLAGSEIISNAIVDSVEISTAPFNAIRLEWSPFGKLIWNHIRTRIGTNIIAIAFGGHVYSTMSADRFGCFIDEATPLCVAFPYKTLTFRQIEELASQIRSEIANQGPTVLPSALLNDYWYVDLLNLKAGDPVNVLLLDKTETFAEKMSRLQNQVRELSGNQSTIPIFMTPSAAQSVIKGWGTTTNIPKDPDITTGKGPETIALTVRQIIYNFCAECGYTVYRAPEGILIMRETDSESIQPPAK